MEVTGNTHFLSVLQVSRVLANVITTMVHTVGTLLTLFSSRPHHAIVSPILGYKQALVAIYTEKDTIIRGSELPLARLNRDVGNSDVV